MDIHDKPDKKSPESASTGSYLESRQGPIYPSGTPGPSLGTLNFSDYYCTAPPRTRFRFLCLELNAFPIKKDAGALKQCRSPKTPVPNDTLDGPGIYPYGNSVRPRGGIVPDLVLL